MPAEQNAERAWIDVSVPLRSGMVHWPGDAPVRIDQAHDPASGVTVSSLGLSAHAGTHMDAPVHFLPGNKGIEALPFEAVLGPARVLTIGSPRAIEADDLAPHEIGAGERLLFRTRNSDRVWWAEPFSEDFVHLSAGAAAYLAARKVRTVGVDYLSVGGFRAGGRETHVALLAAGVWIIEGLNLSGVGPGLYELVCLPLSIPGGDGAPARVLVRPLRQST